MHYLVTGCSSGLGFEISRKLLEEGKTVTGLSRTLGSAVALNQNPLFEHICCDLNVNHNFEQLRYLRSKTSLCIIINAAQFTYEGDVSLDLNGARDLFNINYFSAVALIEKFKDENLGRAFFVNSVAGVEAQAGQAQYSASKHALQAYAQTLAAYSVGKRFDVMAINPGGLDTELWSGGEVLGKEVTDNFMKPAVIAELIWGFLCLPQGTYVKSAVILPESDV